MTRTNGTSGEKTNGHATTSTLPRPCRERWQPLRGGLLNLYRYDHEEFRYEQGHLLLRGNNGTGKSRVLALQLPFLLDGEIAPHRVEPDGDPAKRMEWNLLMNRHKDRLGYSWLEFGRRDEDGIDRFVTIGCGMSAVAGKGIVGKWFFVTRQRVGRELFLQSAAGPALSRDALEREIAEQGHVYPSARAYRAAVDGALFGLGEQRYEALVDLLIQLRKPQLSRQLDEGQLSNALSQALRPVPESVIGDVAESFRSLEADRSELEGFRRAEGEVATFLREYERYARVAARRRAERVRTTHSAYEHAQRESRGAEDRFQAATAERVRLEGEVLALHRDEAAAVAEEQALREGPEMRSAARLERLRVEAESLAKVAESAAAERDRAGAALDAARSHEVRAAEQAASLREQLDRGLVEARSAAVGAGVEEAHDRALDVVAADSAGRRAAEVATEQIVKRRTQAAEHLRKLTDGVHRAKGEHDHAENRHETLAGQLDAVREEERRAHGAVGAAREALGDAYAAWLAASEELANAGRELALDAGVSVAWEPDPLRDALDEWSDRAEGDGPVGVAVRALEGHAVERLATQAAEIERLRREKEGRLVELRAERERLAQGVHTPPSPPPTRAPDVRQGRLGAPLWRICDFRPEIDDEARAGIEAALEAAGILDAWVTPTGRLESARGDALLVAGTSARVGESHLGTVLVAAVDRSDPFAVSIQDDVVDAVLRHVGCRQGAGEVWVDPTGRWQVGPLHGEHVKSSAEHIGEGARQTARKRRLSDLAVEIAAAEVELQSVEERARVVAGRKARALDEGRRAPSDTPLRNAIAHRTAQVEAVAKLRGQVAAAEERKLALLQKVDEAVRVRLDAARDLGVSRWVDDVLALERAIAVYEQARIRLWSYAREHERAADAVDEAVRRREAAEQALETWTRDWNEKELRARTAASEHQTLESVVGVAAREVVERIARVRRSIASIQQEVKLRDEEVSKARERISRAEAEQELLAKQLDERAGERASAIERLVRAAASGLLRVADAELSEDPSTWSPTRAVEVARRVEPMLSSVRSDDAAWERVQSGLHGQVQALHVAMIAHGYPPQMTVEDELMLVRAPFRGQVLDMPQLRSALVEEITTRQSVLDAREREVIENHLIGEVAAHLHDLLHEAEDRRRDINGEIERRPTSTGMSLRFVWEPVDDGPAGFAEARSRMLRPAATWSPEERRLVGDFLQRQIRAARAADEAASWQEQLTQALDYRAWHRFAVERQQEGRWVRLTKRTHGTGSGGEKAIALTVPQFAAAAAHYTTAGAHAPRLILLDEAFVGVDSDMRKKCMGLLDAFDLDFVMTSEREWGCYETLPGLAIAQLSTRQGMDAVAVTRWIWNGRQRVRDDVPLPPAAPSEPS